MEQDPGLLTPADYNYVETHLRDHALQGAVPDPHLALLPTDLGGPNLVVFQKADSLFLLSR